RRVYPMIQQSRPCVVFRKFVGQDLVEPGSNKFKLADIGRMEVAGIAEWEWIRPAVSRIPIRRCQIPRWIAIVKIVQIYLGTGGHVLELPPRKPMPVTGRLSAVDDPILRPPCRCSMSTCRCDQQEECR